MSLLLFKKLESYVQAPHKGSIGNRAVGYKDFIKTRAGVALLMKLAPERAQHSLSSADGRVCAASVRNQRLRWREALRQQPSPS